MSENMLLNKVKKRINAFEQAIQRLDFVKRHLNQNSSEIKSQIHTSISRHLETLRNREVWLLEQVDTVLGAKEEVLHQQQARLNKALGVLHSSLTHATSSDDETATKHLVQALDELNTTELKAEETPYIAFRADHVALRESILSYGRVDSKGMPLQLAFADANKPSASLPRHVEEYEDSDHHLFYKALQDLKSNNSSICVTMPKLSTRVEDWLQRPMLQLSTMTSEIPSPSSETVSTPVSQTTCAIQNWLSQIKHNPDVEEDDDFEIVDHSGSSQRESPVEDEAGPPVISQEEFQDMFHHIPKDIRLWLLKGSSAKTGPAKEDLHAFFEHIPKDTNMWLATARQQLQSLDELKSGGWFRHIPTEISTWLKRVHDKRASSVEPAVPDLFAHIPLNKSAWLKNVFKAEEAEVQEDKTHLKLGMKSKDRFLHTASNPPASVSSTPNLMEEFLRTSPSATECWLLRPNVDSVTAARECGVKEAAASSFPGTQEFLNGNISNSSWLANAAEVEMEVDSQDFFSHISRNKSEWLQSGKNRKNCKNSPCTISFKENTMEEPREWLKVESTRLTEKSTTIPSNPLDSLRHCFSQLTTSDWLLGGRKLGCNSSQSLTSCPSDCPVASTSSLRSLSAAVSGQQSPPKDLTAWIFQKSL